MVLDLRGKPEHLEQTTQKGPNPGIKPRTFLVSGIHNKTIGSYYMSKITHFFFRSNFTKFTLWHLNQWHNDTQSMVTTLFKWLGEHWRKTLFYSDLNNCINLKHSKMKMYNHLWINVCVLQRIVPTNLIFWSGRHKMFSSGKNHRYDPFLFPSQLELISKLKETLFYIVTIICSRGRCGMDLAGGQQDEPTKSPASLTSSRWCHELS